MLRLGVAVLFLACLATLIVELTPSTRLRYLSLNTTLMNTTVTRYLSRHCESSYSPGSGGHGMLGSPIGRVCKCTHPIPHGNVDVDAYSTIVCASLACHLSYGALAAGCVRHVVTARNERRL